MADKWNTELLLFRQVDRVHRTISGDLNEATFEDMTDYMYKVRNSIAALEAMIAEEAAEDEEYERPELDTGKFRDPKFSEIFEHLMERYKAAYGVIERNNMLGEETMVIEEPV